MLRNFILLLLAVTAFADESDESINIYLKKTLENLKLEMPKGYPDKGIPPLDPLAVDSFSKKIKQGVADVDIKMDSLQVKGLSKFSVDELSTDMQQLKLSIKLNLHELEAQGRYDLNGKVLIFPLYGKGKVSVRAHNVRVGGLASINTENGYLQLAEFDLDKISFDKADLLLENILGGGNLANVVNTLLNVLGKTLFDSQLAGEIRKALVPFLKEQINDQLKKVKLEDILKGFGDVPSVVSGGMRYEDKTNDYIDKLLVDARQEITNRRLDPFKLPDQSASFSKKIVFVTIHGEAKLYNGFLNGLSTIRRIGDTKVSMENGDTEFVIESQLGITGIQAGYSGSAKFQGIGPSISARASSSHAYIYLKVSKSVSDLNAAPVLREFRITSLGGIVANIDGLGPLGWTLGAISSVVVNVIKDVIVKEIEGPIRDVIRNLLRDLKLEI